MFFRSLIIGTSASCLLVVALSCSTTFASDNKDDLTENSGKQKSHNSATIAEIKKTVSQINSPFCNKYIFFNVLNFLEPDDWKSKCCLALTNKTHFRWYEEYLCKKDWKKLFDEMIIKIQKEITVNKDDLSIIKEISSGSILSFTNFNESWHFPWKTSTIQFSYSKPEKCSDENKIKNYFVFFSFFHIAKKLNLKRSISFKDLYYYEVPSVFKLMLLLRQGRKPITVFNSRVQLWFEGSGHSAYTKEFDPFNCKKAHKANSRGLWGLVSDLMSIGYKTPDYYDIEAINKFYSLTKDSPITLNKALLKIFDKRYPWRITHEKIMIAKDLEVHKWHLRSFLDFKIVKKLQELGLKKPSKREYKAAKYLEHKFKKEKTTIEEVKATAYLMEWDKRIDHPTQEEINATISIMKLGIHKPNNQQINAAQYLICTLKMLSLTTEELTTTMHLLYNLKFACPTIQMINVVKYLANEIKILKPSIDEIMAVVYLQNTLKRIYNTCDKPTEEEIQMVVEFKREKNIYPTLYQFTIMKMKEFFWICLKGGEESVLFVRTF